jgi:hypothetical protein
VKVHITDGSGSPADFAIVTLQNTVDGDAYLEQSHLNRFGTARFAEVPDGEYSALAFTFDEVLVDPEFEVTADHTIGMDLADATVRPHVTLPHHRLLQAALSVQRSPERGFGIPFGFSGPHFNTRIQPTPGGVQHGSLNTGVTAALVSGRAARGYDDVALTSDVATGVPDDLTFTHRRHDFARVTDRFYGNGPAADRRLMLIPGNSAIDLFGGMTELPVPVPGRLRLWVQAGPDSYAQQTVFPLAGADEYGDNTQVVDVRRYRTAGNREPIVFLHGPVGPGLESTPRSGGSSGVVRQAGHLRLFVPLFGGAGGSMSAFADRRDADWSLRQGGRTLAEGHELVAGDIRVPRGPRTYRLNASTHPRSAWDLSTRVSVRWIFHSRAGQSVAPLLTPRYVPPTTMAGNRGPGRTAFPLTFHSTPRSARVRHVSVELSTDDGRTWHRVRATRTSALTFRVRYHNPAAHGDQRYASLRVTAEDGQGNSVHETAIHAYRLR